MKTQTKGFSERVYEIRNEIFATIRKEMERIGRDIENEDAREIEFFNYKDADDGEINGISSEGYLLTFSSDKVSLEDADIDLGNFAELADDLKGID